MIVYFVLLAGIIGLAYPLVIKNPNKGKQIAYLALTFGYMWFLATVRMDTGFDYHTYIEIFEQYKTLSWEESLRLFEPGFGILTKTMGLFINSSVVMYGVYALLTLFPIAYVIYKESSNIWLSTWLYVTMAFFFTNMNFVRQSLACAVAALGYRFFLEKKHVPFLLIALLAGSFHKTALILIPIYLVAQIPLTVITGSIYGAIVLFSFLFSNQILDFIMEFAFEEYRGTTYITSILGPTFLIVPFVLLIAGGILYPLWKKRNPVAGMLLNILIINATFWLFGSLKHMVIERFCMYSYFYSVLIVPDVLLSLKMGPEDHAELENLNLQMEGRKNPQKHVVAQRDALLAKEKDHEIYYYSGAIGIVLVTFIYIYYGMYIGNFHNVIDYQSVLPFFNNLFGLGK